MQNITVGTTTTIPVAPAQDGADTGQQFAHTKGFGEVIIGAEFKAGNPVDFVLAGGEHDDGDGAFFAQHATDRKAVEARQHYIQHYNVGFVLSRQLEGGDTIACTNHRIAFTFEIIAKRFCERGIVFYEQNRGHGVLFS
jgi:hypothetical protein